MKFFPGFIWIFLMTLTVPVRGQIHEFGFTGGGNNIVGDIGREDLVIPDGFYLSGHYRWNINPWYSLRINGMYSRWQINDLRAQSRGRRLRAWDASGNTQEISVLLEYNFLPLNPYKRPRGLVSTPYLMIGAGYYMDSATSGTAGGTDNAFTLPVGFGIKFSLSRRFKFHYEVLVRYAFSDNLEMSRIRDNTGAPMTNRWSNDWFITNGIGFSVGFGEMPCYINVF